MRAVAKWALVSAATLVAVELLLTRAGRGTHARLNRQRGWRSDLGVHPSDAFEPVRVRVNLHVGVLKLHQLDS